MYVGHCDEGSTPFINLRALGCSDLSAVRMLLVACNLACYVNFRAEGIVAQQGRNNVCPEFTYLREEMI